MINGILDLMFLCIFVFLSDRNYNTNSIFCYDICGVTLIYFLNELKLKPMS